MRVEVYTVEEQVPDSVAAVRRRKEREPRPEGVAAVLAAANRAIGSALSGDPAEFLARHRQAPGE